MVLGIVLHTANIFAVQSDWLVSDPAQSPAFDAMSAAIHVFRMPAFFWISGYFFALTFSRGGTPDLVRKRITRLAVPLLVTWLTLNVLQVGLLAHLNGIDMRTALGNGIPLYHLWFLFDLIIFTGVAALVLPWVDRTGSARWRFLDAAPVIGVIAMAAGLSFVVNTATRATGIAYESIGGLTSLYRLVTYAPFFAAGILMFRWAGLRKRFLSIPFPLLVVTVPLAILAASLTRHPSLVVRELALFLEILMVWVSAGAVLNFFSRHLSRDSRLSRYLSESAYSIFLFHHPIVLVLGIAMLPLPLGAWLKFTLICAGTLALSVAAHELLVRRSPALRFAFNGRR